MAERWSDRPREEAFLFNPAFLSSIMCEFTREYCKAKKVGCPVTLNFLAPAISLHIQTRERLPHSTVSSLYEWIQYNEDVLVDLPRRLRGLLPFLREALMFSLHQQTLEFDNPHTLTVGEKNGYFTTGLLKGVTKDMADAVQSTRFLARWFAKSGSETSILSSWGVQP
ncbi:MAG: hypothetical protein J0L55_06140 [Caulobacterales bacterium]|nr:hypothetical protein [Caulobacterales bacterium]MCA0373615.1 DUF6521 family protein [Pseudomonadota bacterium]